MSRFKFRLQRLLDLRQKKEQEAASAVGAARNAAEAATRREDELTERRDATRQELLPAAGQTVRVAELHEIAFLVRALDERVQDAQKAAKAAERSVQEKLGELGEAMRDRRILDRLKDRRSEEWRAEDARQEREIMDAIARDRFADSMKPKPESDS
ncbi:MAG: flagellar export protein FliJ [Gemmatimonadota bacterium]|nr:flagellar export protein FliJ [Gemmatimonadota bacterium]